MSRYIDAENAIERFGAYLMADAQIEWGGTASENIEDWKELATDIIKGSPSIDICFCRECKWCDDVGKKRALICTNPYIDVDPHPNFFCGYGEREGE